MHIASHPTLLCFISLGHTPLQLSSRAAGIPPIIPDCKAKQKNALDQAMDLGVKVWRLDPLLEQLDRVQKRRMTSQKGGGKRGRSLAQAQRGRSAEDNGSCR